MRPTPLILYLNSKYEEDKIKENKETYQIDLISLIARNLTGNTNIKLWSEFENKLANKNKDNRTAKEIEKNILDKFKELSKQE